VAPGARNRDDELGEFECEGIKVPGGVAKKRWNRDQCPVADMAAGEDDFGDEEVSLREDPAGDDLDEGREGWGGEDRVEMQ